MYYENNNRKTGMATLISDTIELKTKKMDFKIEFNTVCFKTL